MRFLNTHLYRLLFSLMTFALLAGCALESSKPEPRPPTLNALVADAAQQMLADYPDLNRATPIIAASFVDIDNLQRSSTFGRISAELFASELSRAGLAVREVKMRDSLFIEENVGELILSREVRRLVSVHDARAILLGTYAVGQREVYISTRVVRASDALVLGTAHFAIPLDNHMRSLLGSVFY